MYLTSKNNTSKSTLIKILTKTIQHNKNSYLIDNQNINNPSPTQTHKTSISIIYQELSLLKNLSITKNLLIKQLPSRHSITHPRTLHTQTRKMLERIKLKHLNADAQIKTLSLTTQQLIKITKILNKNPHMLIFNKPTTTLSKTKTKTLLTRIHQLHNKNHTMIYITHHLKKMFEINNHVTILHDNKLVTTTPLGDFNQNNLIASIINHQIKSLYPTSQRTINKPQLRIKKLQPKNTATPIEFKVHTSKIINITSLLSSNRNELLRAIFNTNPINNNHITINNTRMQPNDPHTTVQTKLKLLTKNHKRLKLLLKLSIHKNASLTNLNEISRFWLINKKHKRRIMDQYLNNLKLHTNS